MWVLFPSCYEWEATLQLWCVGFSLPWLPLLRSTGSGCLGFSSCSTWTLELDSVVAVCGFSCSAVVGPSWTRDLTHVYYIGRHTLNHWATREVPMGHILRMVAPEHEKISSCCLTSAWCPKCWKLIHIKITCHSISMVGTEETEFFPGASNTVMFGNIILLF